VPSGGPRSRHSPADELLASQHAARIAKLEADLAAESKKAKDAAAACRDERVTWLLWGLVIGVFLIPFIGPLLFDFVQIIVSSLYELIGPSRYYRYGRY
jgi:hypothetical protein